MFLEIFPGNYLVLTVRTFWQRDTTLFKRVCLRKKYMMIIVDEDQVLKLLCEFLLFSTTLSVLLQFDSIFIGIRKLCELVAP